MFTGTSKKKLYIPVHQILISEEKRSSLLALYAITGCYTTSQFAGIGKLSAWRTFATLPRLLERLGEDQYPDGDVLSNAEAFFCHLYNRGTKEVLINDEMAATFLRGKKSLDGLPQTQDTLHLHIKRARLRALYGRRHQNPAPCCPAQRGIDGTVKKVFSKLHWSLCHRYRQDAYNWHVVSGILSIFSVFFLWFCQCFAFFNDNSWSGLVPMLQN